MVRLLVIHGLLVEFPAFSINSSGKLLVIHGLVAGHQLSVQVLRAHQRVGIEQMEVSIPNGGRICSLRPCRKVCNYYATVHDGNNHDGCWYITYRFLDYGCCWYIMVYQPLHHIVDH